MKDRPSTGLMGTRASTSGQSQLAASSLLLLLQAIKLAAMHMWKQLMLVPVPLWAIDSGQCVCNNLVMYIWSCISGRATHKLHQCSMKGQQADTPLLCAAPSQLSGGLDAAPQTDCSPVMQELVTLQCWLPHTCDCKQLT